MGLLDQFGNLSPEQTQGLLAAASQMLQQSGPSRTPTSFGQVLGGGLGAYQQSTLEAQRRKIQEEEAAQMKRMRGLQMRNLESDNANQEQQRARAEQLRQFFMKDGAQPQVQQPQPMEDLPPLGATPMQSTPGMQAPQMQTQAPSPDIYKQRLAMAERLRSAGFASEADAQEASALKFQPKVKNWQEVQVNGKVMYAPYYEDGTSGQPVPLEVARKLVANDSGQSIDMTDPYTGAIKSSIGKKQTLESLASNATSVRGQNMTDARAREFNATQAEANNIKRGEKKEVADMTKASQVASFDTMLGTLDRLGKHPGLSGSVGLRGMIPTVPGSEPANFQAELDTFQSQAFIPMVAQLKGMGALSDAEGKKLTAAVGALNPKMGEKAFRASIGRIVGEMESARDRVAGVKSAAKPTAAPVSNIPQGAISYLRTNPSLRAEFDAKFGEGAAARVLGK
jgi:hypothetical protein